MFDSQNGLLNIQCQSPQLYNGGCFFFFSYEVSNSMGGGITLSDPSTVLRRRSANADGYANLFATMCK